MTSNKKASDSDFKSASVLVRDLPVSSRKLHLLTKQISGLPTGVAKRYMQFSRKKAALYVLKALNSAEANAENNFGMDMDALYVKKASVGQARALKRFRPRAKGRASRILKRRSHLFIDVQPLVNMQEKG